jgi:hypothetical protein
MTDKWIRLYNALFITLQNITRNAAPPTFKIQYHGTLKEKEQSTLDVVQCLA